jgi:hypothetical protein
MIGKYRHLLASARKNGIAHTKLDGLKRNLASMRTLTV